MFISVWLLQGYFRNSLVKKLDKNFANLYKLIKFKEIVWGEFMLFRRKALEEVGGFSELYERASAEDLEMVFQLYAHGFDIYADPRVFVYHEGSRSQTSDIIS